MANLTIGQAIRALQDVLLTAKSIEEENEIRARPLKAVFDFPLEGKSETYGVIKVRNMDGTLVLFNHEAHRPQGH